MSNRGGLLIISGPSGSGKSTIIDHLRRRGRVPFEFSVSATSRAPRAGEVEGCHYHFVDQPAFKQMIAKAELLEYAEVHGNWYGTPRQPVDQAIAQGKWVLLEIDTEGHRQVKENRPDAISFFVRAGSEADYEKRLRARKTESEEQLQRRMDDVREQLARAVTYDFQIVNESIEQAVRTIETLFFGLQKEEC